MAWEGVKTNWVLAELVHFDTDIQRWENNMQFLYENLGGGVNFSIKNAMRPKSGINPPAITIPESSAADTYKPVWRQAAFDATSDEALYWEFTSWFDSDGMTGLKIPYTMDTNNSSATVVFNIQIAAITDGNGSVTAKAFDTDNLTTITVPDNENTEDLASCPITNWDDIQNGDRCIILVSRKASSSDDTATGDLLMKSGLRFYK